MRFVLVNDRYLPYKHGQPRRCAFCCEVLGTGYVRECATRILYCKLGCYKLHVFAATAILSSYTAPKLLTQGRK